MERLKLQATVRTTVGNGPARVLRRSGQVPEILYGRNTEPVMLSVNTKELEQILSKGSFGQFILNLVIQNGKKMTKAAMIGTSRLASIQPTLGVAVVKAVAPPAVFLGPKSGREA